MGGGDGRRRQKNEGDAYIRRERLDKENKQVRSMLREERSKTMKKEAIIVIKKKQSGERGCGVWRPCGIQPQQGESTTAVRQCHS